MRDSLSAILGSTWAVLAAVACTPGVHAAQQPKAAHAARAPLPGAPSGVTAFVDVGVVPMDQERVLAHQTVLVKDGWITALGPVRDVRVPAGAVRIEGQGKFLLPGLADMHAHLVAGTHIGTIGGFPLGYSFPAPDSARADERLFLWLANGVTTIRNLDYLREDWGKMTLRLRAVAAAGQAWFPRIYTAGPWGPARYLGVVEAIGLANLGLTTQDTQPLVMDSIAGFIAAYKAKGYDLIKVHEESPAVLDSVLAVAKRLGIPVAGHIPLPTTVEHILPLGYKSIEHPFTGYLWGNRKELTLATYRDTVGFGVLAGQLRNAGIWSCLTESHYDRLHDFGLHVPVFAKVLQDSGVKLLVGTDELPWQGVITRELQAFVAAGLTPYQALVAGTRNVALYFGTLDQSGTITVGKRADLVLLTGNPLQDVRYTAQPAGVMLGGRWLSREAIDRRLATFKFPTYTPGVGIDTIAVKSYWANVVDEFVETTEPVFAQGFMWFIKAGVAPNMPAPQLQLRRTYTAQLHALIDSLGTSNQYAAGTQRVVHLLAQQLGTYRETLTPEQRTTFDKEASAWLQQRAAQGYAVDIPGVQH